MNQTEQVKAYLELHDGITPKEAMDELGIYRLGARIFDLKQQGVKILSEFVNVPTRSRETARVKCYKLARGEAKG